MKKIPTALTVGIFCVSESRLTGVLREDFARLGVQTARLLFTTESPEECARIARAFVGGAPLEGEFTRGLYKRGVE